jgi:hypothetical protein
MHISGDSDMTIRNPSLYDLIMSKHMDALVLDLDSNTNNSGHCDGGPQPAKLIGDEYGFGNTELEDLLLSEGPQ